MYMHYSVIAEEEGLDFQIGLDGVVGVIYKPPMPKLRVANNGNSEFAVAQ